MEHVNGRIIIATIILSGAGAYRVLFKNQTVNGRRQLTLTRVVVGAYILAILASIIDLVGGPASEIAGLLLMLAVLSTLLVVLPDILSRIQQRNTKPITPGGGSHPTVR